MLTEKYLALFLLYNLGLQIVLSSRLVVSQSGEDMFNCGNASFPCRSVRFAVNMSNSGDEILIDYAQRTPYEECKERSHCSIELEKSLSFVGVNGTAVLKCRKNCDFFKIKNSGFLTPRIVFSNLTISTSNVIVRCSHASFDIFFRRCVLNDYNNAVANTHSKNCFIHVFNSSFGKSFSSGITISCVNLFAHITSTYFNSSPVKLQTVYDNLTDWQTTDVFISDSIFDGREVKTCTDLLAIKPFAALLNITIHSSSLRNFFAVNCSQDERVHTLLIFDNLFKKRNGTFITLNELVLENNRIKGSAVYLVPALRRRSTFKVELINSVFKNNSRPLQMMMKFNWARSLKYWKGPNIQLSNNTFLKNFEGLGSIAPVILFDNGRYDVISCRFLDNAAGNGPFPAVVKVIRKSIAAFDSCYFESSQPYVESIQVYTETSGRLLLTGKNTFNITALKSTEKTIFIYSPVAAKNHLGAVIKDSFRVLCPRGYDIKLSSQCSLLPHNKINCLYLYVSCGQCPSRTYSLSRGELHNTTSNNIQCHSCPRGGQCEAGQVFAKPNFWGYQKKHKVTFLSCPSGYCCREENCTSYYGCHGNRTGTLCGQCAEGMSEPLFNKECKPNKDCTSLIFWPGTMCFLVLYLMFFLYHEEIASFVRRGFSLKFSRAQLSSRRNSDVGWSDEVSSSREDHEHNHLKGSGFLKIIFYYYQVVHLLRDSVSSRGDNYIIEKPEKVISRMMNLIIVSVPSLDCPFKNLRPVEKATILHSMGYCLLALIGLIYLNRKVFEVIKRLKRVVNNSLVTEPQYFETFSETERLNTSRFSVRMVSAFTQISLLMYSSTAQLCLSLLHCVPVRDSHVLFIDGTVKCYQTFQYFLIAYFILSILPFCLVPVLGSYLLKTGRVSVLQFCIACIFPLPFSCFWLYLLLRDSFNRRANRYLSFKVEADENIKYDIKTIQERCSIATFSRQAILRVLVGPFRPHKPSLCFPAFVLPWEGFLIFRRLVLIIVLTFIYDNRLRMILTLTICVAILVCHTNVRPFRSTGENLLETLSLSTLVVLCGFTLVKALYQGENFSSSSNSLRLLNIFSLVENIVIIAPLTIILFIALLSVIIRCMIVLRYCVTKLKYCCRST